MRLVWVKTLLRYAHKELELIPRQPWEGLDIQVSKEQTRRAWRDEELQQLFGQQLFTKYDTPKGCKSGSDAAYWIPLIGLYTGARIGELAQLRADDIFVVGLLQLPQIAFELGLSQPYAIRETLVRGTAQKGRVSRELRTPQSRGNISGSLGTFQSARPRA